MEHLLNRYPGPLLSGPLSQAWIYRFQVPGIFHRAPTFQATHLPAPLFAKYHRMEDNAMNEDRIKIADEYPRYSVSRNSNRVTIMPSRSSQKSSVTVRYPIA